MTVNTVCVYCGSSNNVDDIYKQSAIDLGKALVDRGLSLVYGGGDVGLMGITASTVMNNGGSVTGIIPKDLMDMEVPKLEVTNLHIVDNMHERKIMMAKHADAFVTLPGGFGSLDETFEVLTWKQLGFHSKPIIFYNVNNYWVSAIKLIDHITSEGFASEKNKELFDVANNLDDIFEALNKPPVNVENPQDKWK